ncbi:transcriptional regulator [Paenarthrobacter histidinolovorans]|nr:transcriptional regulator [Paenarthrobacter histidinolovorans]
MKTSSVFPLRDENYQAVYAEEAAMVDAGELIAEAMEKAGLSRSDLARKLGVPRSEITARLSGERNITVRNLAKTLHALGSKLLLDLEREPVEEQQDPSTLIRSAYWVCRDVRPRHEARPGNDRLVELMMIKR